MLNLNIATRISLQMSPVNFIAGNVFLVLMLFGCTSQALSVTKSAKKSSELKSANSLQSYVWYDGDQKRKVWLNPGLIAEFQHDAAGKSLIKNSYPAASVRKIHHRIRIWEQKKEPFKNQVLNRNASTIPTQSSFSPVFHDTSTSSGSIRALPGNLIVYLNPNWGQDEITRWIALRGLEVVNKIGFRPNALVLKTEPGIKALQLANDLYESGEVVAAFPDWWLEGTMR